LNDIKKDSSSFVEAMLAEDACIRGKREFSARDDNGELLSLRRSGGGLCEIVRVSGRV
jgi:hypothetical protein